MKKVLKIMLFLTILGCICCMLYVHRRVIKDIITGEELPEMPAGHFNCICYDILKKKRG